MGLRDTPGGVAIPYHDEQNNTPFKRTRLSLGGERRFRQPPGVALAPYGLHRLNPSRERGILILVEGESYSWALWHAGLAALGLPGARGLESSGPRTCKVFNKSSQFGNSATAAILLSGASQRNLSRSHSWAKPSKSASTDSKTRAPSTATTPSSFGSASETL